MDLLTCIFNNPDVSETDGDGVEDVGQDEEDKGVGGKDLQQVQHVSTQSIALIQIYIVVVAKKKISKRIYLLVVVQSMFCIATCNLSFVVVSGCVGAAAARARTGVTSC